jgi:hypothetical protein
MRYEFHDLADGTPPELLALAGLEVARAWVINDDRALVVRFTDGTVFAAEDAPAVGVGVTTFKIGAELPDADFALLDERVPQTPYTENLACRAFVGVDGPIT